MMYLLESVQIYVYRGHGDTLVGLSILYAHGLYYQHNLHNADHTLTC